MKYFLLKIVVAVTILFALQNCSSTQTTFNESLAMNIIPKPQDVEILDGSFVFKEINTLAISTEMVNSTFFKDYLASLIPGLTTGKESSADILLELVEDADFPDEGYRLQIQPEGIVISAKDEPGIFYGIQSLRQLLPVTVEQDNISIKGHRIRAAVITDHPRFAWRGMHLDVSRHFFPAEFIKQYIDMIALHKMNVFHWHLTDDNGWRLEIKQYPKLTEVSAWRVDREHEDWRKWSPVKPGEKATYGGFYTQKEVKEIVAYAAERQITIIPEIEMPGHSSEIFAAYPELSCKGEVLDVRPAHYWPNEDILCAGNDSVFTFLENIIDEVVELFPAEYIHIGGDEAAKTNWETCPKCQTRIKSEGLTDEHELQSWFIQKMEKYIQSKGKRLIGWDEILEGGLAPDATVMSWRGEVGGIAAAKAGHDVVMTPNPYVYFDYYQGDPKSEPQAIGGYLPLRKVYSYEPIPAELSAAEQGYILGAQANLWTEFVKTTDHAEYMVLPRMTALSEVVWSEANQRDWSDFKHRLTVLLPRFKALDWNFRSGSFMVEIIPGRIQNNGAIAVELISEKSNFDIRYTLDGKDPDAKAERYSKTLLINQDAKVRTAIFDGEQIRGTISKRDFAFHQALNAKTIYDFKYNSRYKGGGDRGLVNGILGSDDYNDGAWQGFHGDDLGFTIDLGEKREISKIEMNFLQSTNSWIFMPEYLEVSISDDGADWMLIKRVANEVSEKDEGVSSQLLSVSFPTEKTQFVKVLAKNRSVCPDWHPGANDKAWIFCDEVIVR